MNHKKSGNGNGLEVWRVGGGDKYLNRDSKAASWKDRRWFPECGILGKRFWRWY